MKRGWYKNKETGDVVFVEGVDKYRQAVVMRDRHRTLDWVNGVLFARQYEPVKASGFPSLKPKEFKPRYAIYDHWSEGEAFVMEFEPGKFKVVMKDGREVLRDEGTCKHFAKFFKDGSWPIVAEAEALARLDKPKPPVPAAEQFDHRRDYYGLDVKYHATIGGEFFYVTRIGGSVLGHRGTVHTLVVRNLWDLGMVSKERPRSTESIAGQASAILDMPKKAFASKKKILVEWLVPQEGILYGRTWATRFLPECNTPTELYTWGSPFKTGRTVEVPE